MKNKNIKIVAFVLSAVMAVSLLFVFSDKKTNIGTARQFAWTDNIFDSEKTTAELTYHSPVKQNIAIITDKEWEGSIADSFCITESENGYTMYYSTYDTLDNVKICVATSTNGINWEKPSLNFVPFNGDKTNIILDSASGISGGFFAFKDTNPSADKSEKYKAIAPKSDGKLVYFTSEDGLRWTEGTSIAKADDAGIATITSVFWNSEQQKYFCYYTESGKNGNNIVVITSKDFVKWSKSKSASYTGSSKSFDMQTANITPYYRGENTYIGLPLRSVELDESVINSNFKNSINNTLTDTVFMSSSDGYNFNLKEEAYITPGPQGTENWLFGDSLVASGIVETPSLHADKGQDNELSIYVAENMLADSSTTLSRHSLRMDGFASYSAPFSTQKLVTKPLVFGGNRMTINFATSTDGYVYVRILDKNGKPYKDIEYTLEDGSTYSVPEYTSYKLIGDRVDREVVFNGDLSDLVGKTVVLEFYMSDAEIYSFKFDNEDYTNTSSWQPQQIEVRQYEDFKYDVTEDIIHIGSDRQLFVDNYIVDESLTDAKLVSHSPQMKEALFKTDLPWEGDNCDFYVIIDDVDSFGTTYHRMYYLGWDSTDFSDIRVCYAYSYDGIQWIKPNLGIHSYTDKSTGKTYTETNIMLYTEEEIFDNFFVMKDTREGVPASQRYIAICQGRYDQLGYPSYGLWAWVSSDGLHWKKTHRVLPEMEHWFGSFDSVNTLVWDEATQQLFTYFRVRESQMVDDTDIVDFRKIYGATNSDFTPYDTDTLFALNYGENAPLFEMYTNNISKYSRAPQIFIGFPTRFSRNYTWSKNYEYLAGTQARLDKYNAGQVTRTLSMTDTMFMTSRDGYTWNRQNEAYITPGPEYEANWIYGNCYPAYGLVETESDINGADRELSTYLFEGKFYNEPTVFYRYTFRLDGFKSYKGNYNSQKVTTRPLTFTGDEMQINFKTSAAGSVKVNILDENRKPIDGYSSQLLIGDNTDRTVQFQQDLSALNGKTVTLEFILCDAEIYSFIFQ